MRDTTDHIKLKFSALAAEYYRLISERHLLASSNNYKQGNKKSELLFIVASFIFKRVDMTRAMIAAFHIDFVV